MLMFLRNKVSVLASMITAEQSKSIGAVRRKHAAASLSTLKWMVLDSNNDGTPKTIIAPVPSGMEGATSLSLFETGKEDAGFFKVENGVATVEGKAIDRLVDANVQGEIFDSIRGKTSAVSPDRF